MGSKDHVLKGLTQMPELLKAPVLPLHAWAPLP